MNTNKKITVEEASKIYVLPNSLTAANMLFGFLAIIKCIQGNYSQAVWFIFVAFVFDALDGRVARIGGKESLFGKEFDSIADIVSFGMAPALMLFFLMAAPESESSFLKNANWLIGFTYLLCSGIRLARFNVITHPLIKTKEIEAPKYFIGLPVPAAAGTISSLVLLINAYGFGKYQVLIPIFMLFVSWLMISEVPYPNFKQTGWRAKLTILHFIIFFLVAIAVFWFHEIGLTVLFLSYVCLSPIKNCSLKRPLRKTR